jgi:hypothetical protein
MDWIDVLLRLDINAVSEALVETFDFATPSDYWRRHQETTSRAVSTPDRYDVVNGRGRDIQRHAGNKTNRELVSANKVR